MKREKNKEKKHESTIGKIIYGFLLFMPLMAIFVKCGYTMFNKNAYQSYNDRYIQSEQLVNNMNLLSVGNSYTANHIEKFSTSSHSGNYYYEKINIDWTDYGFSSNNYNGFRLYSNDGYVTLYNTTNNTDETQSNVWGVRLFTFTFQYSSAADNNARLENFQGDLALSLIIIEKDTLDNVFYYSVNQVCENPLFNWTTNSIIYTGIANFTTALNITTPFIPLLMTYWLIISVVYFLYDIILIILIVLHKKIHNLEESI